MQFESVPAWTMASKPPLSRPTTGVIGPGQYFRSDDPTAISQTVTIPKAGRSQLVDPAGIGAPGPGHYNTAESTLGKGAVTFKGKSSALLAEKGEGVPGPGHYYKSGDVATSGYSIPRAERDGHLSSTADIGPGHYSTPDGLGKRGISIPRTGREGEDLGAGVGPGAYQIARDLGNPAQGSFGL